MSKYQTSTRRTCIETIEETISQNSSPTLVNLMVEEIQFTAEAAVLFNELADNATCQECPAGTIANDSEYISLILISFC